MTRRELPPTDKIRQDLEVRVVSVDLEHSLEGLLHALGSDGLPDGRKGLRVGRFKPDIDVRVEGQPVDRPEDILSGREKRIRAPEQEEPSALHVGRFHLESLIRPARRELDRFAAGRQGIMVAQEDGVVVVEVPRVELSQPLDLCPDVGRAAWLKGSRADFTLQKAQWYRQPSATTTGMTS